MNKNTILFASFLLSAAICGCSSSTQEQKTGQEEIKQRNIYSDNEAYSDSSAPLPIDSADIGKDLPVTAADSTRNPVNKAPFDSQVREQQTVTKQPEITENPAPPAVKPVAKKTGEYTVQLGAFKSQDNANKYAKNAKNRLGKDVLIRFSETKKLYILQLNPVETRLQAEAQLKELRKKNFKDVFVVRTGD
ncbi:MAG: SPOR domain-containing protein [Ignavibacteriales bacterium]